MTEDMDAVIDYDGEIENDGNEFVTLPDNDEVSFSIEKIEKGYSKKDTKPMVTITFKVISIAGHGSITLNDYIVMTKKSEWKLCEFFTCLGMRKHGERLRMRWDIIGYVGRATVAKDEFIGRDGVARYSNKIKKYLEPVPQAAADGGAAVDVFG